MADFSLPTLTTLYADFLVQMKQRDEDVIRMLDGTTSLNLPSGAKRWNATANKWEKYNGTSWSDLSTLYEIKVADSNKLNGQFASYYAIASHTHTGYAATNHTHSEYAATGHNHNSAYLGISAKAADSSLLNGKAESVNAGANTIGLRDASGDFFSRLFRSTYAEQTAAPVSTAHICFRNNASSDNYMRFMTGSAFKAWLAAIGVSTTDTNTWRGITDSVTTTSSTISASATAVKTAYDTAVQASNALTYSPGSKIEAISWTPAYLPQNNNITKLKEIVVCGTGTVTVRFKARNNTDFNIGTGSGSGWFQIYVNGTARGRQRTPTTTAYTTYTEDITVNKGDLVQIYGQRIMNPLSDCADFAILVATPLTSNAIL